ncbi:hypothetical protein MEO40_26300 [Dolichospermum sp. ST_sed1]|nr:hypothetical protein [Dolichospermum sp. ST_sed1]MDD1429180.1 hypothetical protein [Dolichospermum sp. ST_sed9]MDD1434688.1 hypothetical protein [Dolichospermum sp. ST_sed6]MDD1438544.1 hypothetical protein [Dolichospermum sp. ST_sed10]MDD1444105.1 hypothetical protein [Dolichospermum sp. ST_sed3]MDD1449534.1 hypothetical protein [Dolichospermum sp. ST_sed8]MDD1458358.1 hypothetical protein [Dolichospermum sp. ST_sed7]MDD1463516.1 hypothetical protein [Dolichospermum sp. ST_sed2]MDD14694
MRLNAQDCSLAAILILKPVYAILAIARIFKDCKQLVVLPLALALSLMQCLQSLSDIFYIVASSRLSIDHSYLKT